MKGIKPWELAALAALTILFLAFASVNMGSFAMPSSSWQPSTSTAVPAEGSGAQEVLVVIDLGSVQQVNEIYVFLSDAKRTKFELYGATSSDDRRRPLAAFDKDPATHIHFCSWERLAIGNKSTSSLIFVFDASSEGEIGEIVILSAANEKIAPVDVTGGEGAQRLVDEQDLITLPITQKYGAYFDEMYFVRTAQEHLNLEEPYEWTHPPLGKLIIGLGIALFGMNPFSWRILGVFAAAAMIPLMFLFGKRMFKSSLAGFIAAFLLTFDFMHFSLARLATGEIYLLLFSLLMFYFAFEFFSKREEDIKEEEGAKNKAATSLFLSIVCFGLGFSVKWTALFGLIAVLILVAVSNIQTKRPLLSDSKTILAGLLVSAAIYIATYIPYMLSGEGHGLIDIHRLPLYIGYLAEYLSSGTINPSPIDSLTVFDLQLRMFGYHAGIEATHPYSSPWWSWPLMLKPLWMYSNTLSGGTVSTIVLMGNPALWWGGIPALILIGALFVAKTIKKVENERNFVLLFILVPFLLQWLSYALIARILFIYHFVANVPFMIFAVTYWLHLPFEKDWSSQRTGLIVKCLVIAFLVVVAVLFFLFYPVISGYPVAYEYKESLRWLSGWAF
ncbi:MAG TPA: phospholipid carrier-dependent glycosyltransferase [Desulfobacteria bacterium]|nr:phospholipid carrier-dependent glycosyltransferase [Desulfobacteria bacterium]